MDRKTPLKRKTPLRAKTGLKRARIKRREGAGMVGATDARRSAYVRAAGLCECGCGRRLEAPCALHHVFFRSRLSRRVRDEIWNLALIREECHVAIHDGGDQVRRKRTERRAVARLLKVLSVGELEELVARIPDGATEPSATVAAYEQMRLRPSERAA